MHVPADFANYPLAYMPVEGASVPIHYEMIDGRAVLLAAKLNERWVLPDKAFPTFYDEWCAEIERGAAQDASDDRAVMARVSHVSASVAEWINRRAA